MGSIGNYAFKETALSSFEIGKNVAYIGSNAFENCASLANVTFEAGSTLSTISASAFKNTALSSFNVGKNVTSIGNNAFEDCVSLANVTFEAGSTLSTISASAFKGTALSSLEIGKSVTSIGNNAFENCEKLTSVTFEAESTLSSIGNYAFSNTKLPSFTIGRTVTAIGSNAFENCTSFANLTFEAGSTLSTIGNNAFANTPVVSVTIPGSVSSMGTGAFAGCTSLVSASFADNSGFASLNSTFANCTSLKTVSIGNNCALNDVKFSTFSNCNALETLTFGDNCKLTTIPTTLKNRTALKTVAFGDGCDIAGISANAFAGCSALESVTFGNNNKISFIEEKAFDGRRALKTFSLGTGCTATVIGDNAFRNTALTAFAVPASIVTIGEAAFSGCSDLGTVTFDGTSLDTIGRGAFRYSGLTGIDLPDSVKTISEYAFAECPNLTYVNLGDSSNLTTIENFAFELCTKLAGFEIPAGLSTVGVNIFQFTGDDFKVGVKATNPNFKEKDNIVYNTDYTVIYFGYVKSLTISSTVSEIKSSAFAGCRHLDQVYIPATVTVLGSNPFHSCSPYFVFEVDAANPNYKSEGNIVYNKAGTEIVAGRVSDLTVKSGITKILSGAFRGTPLLSVTFNADITAIDKNAFRDTKIASASIPDSVSLVDDYAFSDCVSLKTLVLPANASFTSINEGAFRNTEITHVTIPATVTSIGIRAFQECVDLKIMTLSDASAITSFGDNSFNRSSIECLKLMKASDRFLGAIPISWNLGGASFIGSMILDTTSIVDLSSLQSTYGGEAKFIRGEGFGITLRSSSSETFNTSGAFVTANAGDVYWNSSSAAAASLPTVHGTSYIYSGSPVTAVSPGAGTTVTDGQKTDAGSYVAVAKRSASFPIWEDGTFSDRTFPWTIGKGTIDVSSVRWVGGPFDYDGTPKTVILTGLPDGVHAVYSDNVKTAAGKYYADAVLYVDGNYNTPIVAAYEWEIIGGGPVNPEDAVFAIIEAGYGIEPIYGGKVLSDPTYSAGNITVKYYADYGCTSLVDDITAAPPGIYWMVATVTGLTHYADISSNPVEFIIPEISDANAGTSVYAAIVALLSMSVIMLLFVFHRRRVEGEKTA